MDDSPLAALIIQNCIFFRSHTALDGRTPAEAAGADMTCPGKVLAISQAATAHVVRGAGHLYAVWSCRTFWVNCARVRILVPTLGCRHNEFKNENYHDHSSSGRCDAVLDRIQDSVICQNCKISENEQTIQEFGERALEDGQVLASEMLDRPSPHWAEMYGDIERFEQTKTAIHRFADGNRDDTNSWNAENDILHI